ncbi:hypothetical protein EDB83DRAFT_2336794 [Lactarius deliciosus]|nr:hypothetical protein EDB83DRAFT_2336794 [Lactarius deliciosus]
MSVASANPFALLLEEDSRPGSPAPAKKNDTPTSQTARNAAKSTTKGPASRGGRYYARGGKPLRDSTQDNQEEAPAGDESAKKRDGEGRGRGRGRGRAGGGRGEGRGGRGGRQFDRHSGTGKTDSDKKIHQSWGGDEGDAERKAEEAGTTDAQAEGAAASTDDWGASTNTISYDQYLAQLKETAAASIPKLEGVREANEGADNVWGDVTEHKKNEDDVAYFVGKSKTTTKARAEKKEKVYIEIDARFERPSRGGRGRGGERGRGAERERGRGSGRVGGTRGGRANGAGGAVNVDDETAFPSLS